MTDEFFEAARLVATRCYGDRGAFGYEAFAWVNATLFDGRLPVPLILWELTAHGGCLGRTGSLPGSPPVIHLHPSILEASIYRRPREGEPWQLPSGWIGPAYALDVLIHECTHVSVNYLLGGATGPTSHNNPQWVGETERVGARLGLHFRGGRSITKRVPVESGDSGPRGTPKTRTARVTEDGATVAFKDVARFPHAVRASLTDADAYYRSRRLPFDNALTGACHMQLAVTGAGGVMR